MGQLFNPRLTSSPAETSGRGLRIGVDIGGTFTDVVLVDPSGGVLTRKVLSTTDDYGRAIRQAIEHLVAEAGVDPAAAAEKTTRRPEP